MMIDFFNVYHLGDHLFHLHFLKKLCEIEKVHEYNYFVPEGYLADLRVYLHPSLSGRVHLQALEEKSVGAYNSWMGFEGFAFQFCPQVLERVFFGLFERITGRLGLPNPILSSFDILVDDERLWSYEVPAFDIVFSNSVPGSGQWLPSQESDLAVVRLLQQKGFSVVTTEPVPLADVPCTRDWDYNLLQVGALGLRARFVICVMSSPSIFLCTRLNFGVVEKWFWLGSYVTFEYAPDRMVTCPNYEVLLRELGRLRPERRILL